MPIGSHSAMFPLVAPSAAPIPEPIASPIPIQGALAPSEPFGAVVMNRNLSAVRVRW